MKKNYLILFLAVSSVLLSGCAKDKKDSFYELEKNVTINALHNGDAKFFKNKVVTNVSGILNLISLDGSIERTYDAVNVNWIDVLEEENLLVYGNGSHQVGVVRFNEEYDIVSNTVVMTGENLLIDPTITKADGTYYMTVTEIIGNVNNADTEAENGEYILHLYSSGDLVDWSLVSDVIDANNNIEDVDFSVFDGKFYMVYEKEEVDKGNSAIVIKLSEDNGFSWSEEIELLPCDADQEPATFQKQDDGFILYYSSDYLDPGTSYNGANAYFSTYDSDLKILSKNQLITTSNDTGILLYDTKETGERLYLLYSKDYLTTSDLVIDKLKK